MSCSSLSKFALIACLLFAAFACSEDENGARNSNVFTPTNQGDCLGESERALCDLHDFVCGVHEVTDQCDEAREINCGDEEEVCEEPETCGGGEAEGTCGCTPETDEEVCAAAGVECGPLSDVLDDPFVDACGQEREIESCGDEEEVCGEFETCGGGQAPDDDDDDEVQIAGVCGCTPETDEELCEAHEYECGPLDGVVDSCGEERNIESCGDAEEVCEDFEVCGGATDEDGEPVPGACGCTPQTDEELCADLGVECGPLEEVLDSCEQPRNVDSCGDESDVCDEHLTCGGGTDEEGEPVPGVCGCTPETDEELCELYDHECGPLEGAIDDCGDERDVASCGDEEEVCEDFETCGDVDGDEPGVCICIPETDEELCDAHGVECGPLDDVVDSCEQTRIIATCGIEEDVCDEHDTCGGGVDEDDEPVPGVCGCTPKTCESEGVLCGSIDDGCGNEEVECDLFCAEQVTAFDQHACAVGSGAVKCWGRNDHGQLGVGDTNNRDNPADVIASDSTDTQLLSNVAHVSTGTAHTCALFNDTSVRCWGSNDKGRLGEGSGTSTTGPSTEAISERAIQLKAGDQHTCALVVNPSDFSAGDSLDDIPAGTEGQVQCWGHNEFGQIGDAELDYGATAAVPTPVMDEDEIPLRAVAITVGSNHSCAITSDDEVYCWGRNRYGQIEHLQPNYSDNSGGGFRQAYTVDPDEGIDRPTRINVPVQLDYMDLISDISSVPPEPLWVTAGEDYTCIADGNDDDVFCWGVIVTPPRDSDPCTVEVSMRHEDDDIDSQTGDAEFCSVLPVPTFQGDSTDETPATFPVIEYSIATTEIEDPNDSDETIEVTYRVLEEVFVQAVASEPFHFRLTGASHITDSNVDNITMLDSRSGPNHFCAILDIPSNHFNFSNLVCLGANRSGQLGDGTDNSFSRYREVRRDVDDNPVNATQISLGADFTCAVMDDNNIQCWGSNSHGQIGNSALQEDESFRPFDVRLEVP